MFHGKKSRLIPRSVSPCRIEFAHCKSNPRMAFTATMTSESKSTAVTHTRTASRFEIVIDDATARLDYQLAGDLMTIHHTFVPVELRGQSIAGQLAQAAFDYARAEGLQVIPACSYIAAYAKRSPQAAALIAADRSD